MAASRSHGAEARLQRVLEISTLMSALGRELGPALDAEAVLGTVLEAIGKLVDQRGGRLWLGEGDHLVLAAAEPPLAPHEPERLARGQGRPAKVVSTGASVTEDGWLGVPLICLGETIGVLEVDGPDGRRFDADDVRLLEGLAVQVAGAIESGRRFRHVMELERLKSDFISRVSHELRTPITIIDGFISTMIDHAEHLDPEQRRHMLSRSKAAVGRLSRLIEDLITLSRLETGVVMAHPVTVRLAELLDQVQVGSETPDRVTMSCPDDLEVLTDPALLTRAVGFVVDNALKYGDSAEVIAARAAAAHGPVVITITDRGPGIPDDVRSTVFELFTRSASTTTVPGLGLGLAMARTLLDVLGATIDVSSRSGSGTSVSINIPA